MKYILQFVSFFIIICLTKSLNTNQVQSKESLEKLNIAVYYESKCPDSKRFINNQITKAIDYFPSLLNIILVPFGKANVNIYFFSFNLQNIIDFKII